MHTQESINQLFNGNSKAFGDEIERQYEAGVYKRGDVFLRQVKTHVPLANASILDYGCGTGRISMMLGKEGYRVLGIDPAVDHIEMATSLNRSSNVAFKVLTQAPIAAAASFDAVVSSSVFEFVPDPQQYIQAIYQLLKPGGRLIISFPNAFSLWRIYSKIRFGKRYNHFKFQTIHKKTDLIKQFEKNKFKKIGSTQYYESAFDHKGLSFLNASSLFGTLFVMVFEKR
jgi:2-polyprenyl-3-methyl-5-hydroxy-6-metoxy-1,4-benzoquinol methylase